MEPSQLEAAFLESFKSGVFTRTDFRPHFDGDWINVAVAIKPLATEEETYRFIWQKGVSIAQWLVGFKEHFGKEDKFQIIIAWDESIRLTGRHIIKIRGDIASLNKVVSGVSVEEAIKAGVWVQEFTGWSKNIF